MSVATEFGWRSMALALDDNALEHLDAATGALDHLEVDAHAVTRPEVGDAAQLLALDAFDHCAHGKKKAPSERKSLHCPTRSRMVANPALWSVGG